MTKENYDLSGWKKAGSKPKIVASNKKQKEAPNDLSGWKIVAPATPIEQPQNESFGKAVTQAPFRVAEDLYKGAAGFVNNLPGYIDKAKTEVPGLLNPLNGLRHPIERSKQVISGLAELGHNTLNAPRGITDYAANRLGLIPKEWAEKVPYQEDISESLDKFSGKPKNPGDALLRGITRNATSIMPGAKLASVANPLALTNKAISKEVVRETNRLVNSHTKKYNNLFNRANKTGFNQVPIDNALIDTNLDFIKKYKTPLSYKGIERFSENPTLQNAQTATSDLKKITRSLDEKSNTSALTDEERSLYNAAHESINHIEDNMFRNAEGVKNESLAKSHKNINQSYRENVVPYRYNDNIQKFIDKKITAKQLVNSLNEGEFGAKKSGRHPSLKLRNSLPKNAIGVGSLGGLGWLYKELFGNHQEK